MISTRKAVIALSALLAVSLCANAFLGGVVAARHMDPPPPLAERMGDELRGGLRDFVRDLPPDVRGPISSALREQRGQMGQQMREMMQARRHSMAMMTAEPFDAEQLRTALDLQRRVQQKMQTDVHNRMVDVLSRLSPEQRAELGGRIQKLFR